MQPALAIVEGLEKGASDYLVKPFSPLELITRIRTQLELTGSRAVAKRLEKLVAERTQELAQSNEDLQQFEHLASHDLKEPIRKIKTFCAFLIDEFRNTLCGNPNEDIKDFLQIIFVVVEKIFIRFLKPKFSYIKSDGKRIKRSP